MRTLPRLAAAAVALLLIAACVTAPPIARLPAAQLSAANCAAVRRAVDFLAAQYDPAVKLLREAPLSAPHTHWLATDNLLAQGGTGWSRR